MAISCRQLRFCRWFPCDPTELNVDEAYDNTTEAGSSVSAYTDSGALGVPYAFAR